MKAEDWIKQLELLPHSEGGFFKQTYVSEFITENSNKTVRKLFTSIYFLLRSEDVSHFHRLKSDELWYFHAGNPLTIHMIHENGEYEEQQLGLNIENGEVPQFLVPKYTIFGSSIQKENTFSLVGCMVSPGFEYEDFELFTQDELIKDYPQHEKIIKKLAYETI